MDLRWLVHIDRRRCDIPLIMIIPEKYFSLAHSCYDYCDLVFLHYLNNWHPLWCVTHKLHEMKCWFVNVFL